MKKLYMLGFAMSLLMISLPIVHAASLNVVTIAGQDQMENYYRSNDMLNIEVLAVVEGEDAVESDQLRVYVDAGTSFTYFDSCTPETGTDLHRCVLQRQVFGQSGIHDFKIRLYTDGTKSDPDASPVREDIQQLTVDAIPPTISSINVIESFTDDPSITIDYDVRDTAIAGNSILCSGIREIELREDGPGGNLLATIPGDGTCRMQSTYSLTLPGIDKEYNICLVATDFLGQKDTAPHCDTVTLDRGSPAIGAMNVFDANLDEVDYLSPQSNIPLTFEITIDDISLDKTTVTADFSNINTYAAYVGRSPTRWDDNTAIWEGVPSNGFNACAVTVFAKDNLDYETTSPVTCNIQLDDEGPSTRSLSTGITAAIGDALVGPETLITVVFDESGVGMAGMQAYLDLSRITGQSQVQADACTQSGNDWICTWNITSTQQEGDVQMAVHVNTQDDLGNRVDSENRIFNVSLDRSVPTVSVISVRTISGQYSLGENVTVRGDQVEFTFDVSNFDSSNVFADFSEFGGAEQSPPTSCDETTGVCIFIADVDAPGHYVANPDFYFYDRAGNLATDNSRSVAVFQIEEDLTNPDNWRLGTINCAPDPIDRQVTTLINYNVVCNVPLIAQGNVDKTFLVSADFDRGACTQDQIDYFSDIEIFNIGPSANPGNKEAYFSIRLEKREMDIDDLSITCPLNLLTRIDKTINVNPEQENVTLFFQFFNNPLGSFTDEIVDEVEDVWDKTEDWINTLENVREVLGFITKMCEVKAMITGILATLDSAILILQAIVPPAEAAADQAKAALCNSGGPIKTLYDNSIFDFLNKLCNAVNCQVTRSEDDKIEGTFTEYLTEGVTWCRNATILGDEVGLPYTSWLNLSWPTKVKESIIWSTVCMCLPGIAYNIDKIVQVYCKYGLCLLEDVAEQGLPIRLCKEEKDYDICALIVHEFFAFTPFGALSKLIEKFMEMLANWPATALSMIMGGLCNPFCPPPGTTAPPGGFWTYLGCALPKVVSRSLDAYASIESMMGEDDMWDPGLATYCEDFSTKYDEMSA